MGFIDKPQSLTWRKVLFQVHLWTGLIVGLYIIVVGLTGSILVFKDELAAISYPRLMRAAKVDESQWPSLAVVIENARAAHPKFALVSAYEPGVFGDTFLAYMEGPAEQWLYVFADPADGHILGSFDLKSSWLFWVVDLHVRLLAGQVGFIVNGIGAGFLVLLCLTGLILWWPGIRHWKRAFKVDFNRKWKRINFDLHSAVGFWILALIFLWAMSGVYFVWPKQVEAFIGKFSSVADGVEPEVKVSPAVPGRSAALTELLAQAQAASPRSQLAGIVLPQDAKSPIKVFMGRRTRQDFSLMDHVYFDPSTGKQVAIWHSGRNSTLGSMLVYWLGPLHFGVYWGWGVKVLWAALGLSLPLLTVTGALMYWNRTLHRYWNKLKRRNRKQVPVLGASEEEVFTDR